MAGLFPTDLAERLLSTAPIPVADATAALVGADSAFEERDRVVEVFRAALRLLSAITLAARVQFGKGPGAESPQIADLIRSLRSRGLTDGQWFAIVREMLRPWAQAPGSYPLPELVTLVHGKKAELPKLIDELLAMRKSETVAHGASGTKAAIAEILERRVPQLARLLTLLDALWHKARLVVPLAKPEDDSAPQPAWLLAGDTPARGKWRKIPLAEGVRCPPGEALFVDEGGKPLLALHPILLVRRPSPEAVEEVFVLDGGTKKGAVYVALPSMAEHRETEAWNALSKALSDEEAPPENPEIGSVERPFRGLDSFGPEHGALFFGREEQTEALANRIRRHPFVTVTGPSGSGKTSLLRAGALPTLTDHVVALLRPGSKPLAALCAKIAEATNHQLTEVTLHEALQKAPDSLGALLTTWSRDAMSAGPPSSAAPSLAKAFRIAGEPAIPRIAIVVDQAEEMLTLCHDEAERALFAKALASAGDAADGVSRVVLSVREDFFGRLATVPALRGVYSQVVEVVTTPDRDALARTLYLPAKQFGYAFEDETLITTMVDSVASEPAALALLQFCADRLWEVRDRTWKRLTWDAYRALGGVEGALAAHADRVLTAMSPAQQRACRNLLLRLVTADRTRAVVPKKELIESAASAEDATAVLDRLVAARLLTVGESDEGTETRVEIVHEALLKHWGALSAWLSEDIEGQRLSQALRQAAREWQSRGRPKGLLWRGDALLDLARFRRRATDRLTREEAAFMQASEADERRGTRIRRGVAAAAFVATGAFGAFMFYEWRAAESARIETEHQKARAEVRGLVSEARNLEPAGKVGEALALLRAASALEEAEDGKAATQVSLDMERLGRSGAASRVLAGHAWGLMNVAVSPDKTKVGTASRDGTVKIWDLATGTLVRTLTGKEPFLTLAWSPDGRTIAACHGTQTAKEGFVRLYDVETGAERKALDFGSTVNDVAFSPDGKQLAVATESNGASLWTADGATKLSALGPGDWSVGQVVFSADSSLLAIRAGKEAHVFSTAGGAPVASLTGHEKGILQLALSRSGARVATASIDGTVRIWDSRSGKEIAKLAVGTTGYDKPARFQRVAISPDGKLVAAGAQDGSVRLLDAETGAVVHTLSHHTASIEGVVFSPDGSRLLVTSLDHLATIVDVATGGLVEVLRGHSDGILCGVFADDHRVVTGSDDRRARVWEIADGPYLRVLAGHKGQVERLVASQDGSILVSGATDKSARIWNTNSGAMLSALADHAGPLSALAVTSDGARVATGAVGSPSRLWDARTGTLIASLAGEEQGPTAVAFSKDGAWLATASLEGPIRLRDGVTGAEKRLLEGHKKKAVRLSFSKDGKWLLSASWDGTARIWDVAGGSAPRVLSGAEGWVTAAEFAPDDRTVVIAANEEARVYDVEKGALLRTLKGHEQQINALVFSPDGATIATGSLDSTLRTWRFDTGAPLRTFAGHTEGVMDVAFSPDGQLLYSAGDSTVRVWDAALGATLETLEPHRTDVALQGATAILPLGPDTVAAAAQDGTILLFRSHKEDRQRALLEAGALSNERVCRATSKVVPVTPYPPADSVWAPDTACAAPTPSPP
ncbi:MAG: hypothetical protein U0441_03015 [Polyangiaceae bacterium]